MIWSGHRESFFGSINCAFLPCKKGGGFLSSCEPAFPTHCRHNGGKSCQVPRDAFNEAQGQPEDVEPTHPTWAGKPYES